MNLNGRLLKLEEAFAPADVPELSGLPVDFIEVERERWARLIDGALEAVDDERAAKLAQAAAVAQFRRLHWLVEPGEFEDERQRKNYEWCVRRWFKPYRRFPQALATFIGRLPADLRAPVLAAGLTERERELLPGATPRFPNDSWLGHWLYQLCECGSRVPPDIDPRTFGAVAGAMLTRRGEVPGFMRYLASCPRSGLWVPDGGTGAPRFFDTCPGCGAGRPAPYHGYACHLAGVPVQPWKEWAERELSPEN